jgi:hypothetical protein
MLAISSVENTERISLRNERFKAWIAGLEARHLADLSFQEVSRALRALSATYVEQRGKIREGAALEGAGKRAAFALFYAPLHFLLVREIVSALDALRGGPGALVDLGCGTGAAGAAWAGTFDNPPRVIAIDRHPWALTEAAATYRHFGIPAKTQRGDVAAIGWPRSPAAWVAAFMLNELPEGARESVMKRLLDRRDPMLIVEPLAGFVAPWWNRWRDLVEKAGGRSDEWRFRVDLPPIVAKLDRAAGLDHSELTARSLFISK